MVISIAVLSAIGVGCGRISDDKSLSLNNEKSDKHIKVRGTNILVVPPDNFSEANIFQGYYDFSTTTTLKFFQDREPVQKKIKKYDEVLISPKDLISRQPMTVNGYDGLYIVARDGESYKKHFLFFGDDDVTVTVIGQHLPSDSVMEKRITTAMFSVVLQDEAIPDPRDDADFKIETDDDQLTFDRLLNGMLLYKGAGQNSSSDLALVVARRIGATNAADRQAVVERYLNTELYHQHIQIKRTSPVDIDGMPGYEIIAEGVSDGNNKNELMYLVMLFDQEGDYVIYGTATEKFKENEAMFQEVAGTFQRKK
ncbi:hypothetical protein [Chryseolinea lacunae]|uniref:Uncharacterized protein n=1 Tax=Chryseolinea lacunae TaxID=2801331 RepID=A0ABS1KMM9_9BACT|nr:hypothetical protein [Chryseolinea lacunae]MBL0740709.1 hypothetical protein [Chryseolinea lacunae]